MDNRTTVMLTQQVNIRLTPDEKAGLETRARRAGKLLATWSREQLLRPDWPSAEDRRGLIFDTINTEIIRLTLIAAQNADDITSRESQERIERQARASAEAILDRRLSFVQASKGAA